MKNQSYPLVLVLLVAAGSLGGLLAWSTQPEHTELEPSAPVETAKRVQKPVDLQPPVAKNLEIPVTQQGVKNYLDERWGKRGKSVLNAPAQDYKEGRPVYHASIVYASIDRDGNPIYTHPIWSPLPPRRLEVLSQKGSGPAVGQEPVPNVEIRLDDPLVKQYIDSAKATSAKGVQAMSWANEQAAKGADIADFQFMMPDGLEDAFEKIQAESKQKQKGGGKKK